MVQVLFNALPYIFPLIIGINGIILIITELFFNRDDEEDEKKNS